MVPLMRAFVALLAVACGQTVEGGETCEWVERDVIHAPLSAPDGTSLVARPDPGHEDAVRFRVEGDESCEAAMCADVISGDDPTATVIVLTRTGDDDATWSVVPGDCP